jgi:hypothetical protein
MGPPTEKRFDSGLLALVDAGSGGHPERLFRAIEAELEPVVEHLHRNNPPVDLDRLTWILIELVMNSLTAPLGKILAVKTGLPMQELLDVFGTSVLWPHPSPDRIDWATASWGDVAPLFTLFGPARSIRLREICRADPGLMRRVSCTM